MSHDRQIDDDDNDKKQPILSSKIYC